MNVQPFLPLQDGWIEVRDGNDTARDLFRRHYSYKPRRSAAKRVNELIIGPGYKLLLLTSDGGALCAWRRERHRADGQRGVECCIFRREQGDLASVLLATAMSRATAKWPGERMFTFIDPRKVQPTMVRGHPVWGFVFYRCGWHFAGLTAKGLHILETRSA